MESNKTSWITTIIFILILILVIVTITLYITKKDETCDMFKNLIVDKLCPIKDPTTESKTEPTAESKTNPITESKTTTEKNTNSNQ
jgi:flagellar basal body-associated protein FliL